MPVTRKEARQLCTKAEWALVAASLPPAVNALSLVRLGPKVARTRTLRDKYADLVRRQHHRSRSRRSGRPGERINVRTRRKAQLFSETLRRFEARLAALRKLQKTKAQKQKKTPRGATAIAKKKPLDRRAMALRARRENQRRSSRGVTSSEAQARELTRKVGPRRIQAHVSAATRRRQAKRDTRRR